MNLKMLKRISALVCAAALAVMMAAPAVLAAGDLKITEFYPKDGATGTAIQNMDVKIEFSKDVYSEKNNKSNKKYIKLYDTKTGKEVDTTIAFNKEEKNVVLVLVNGTSSNSKKSSVKGNTKYTCEVKEGFEAADGDTLEKTEKTTFRTQNPKTSSYISFGMIGVMVVGMVFVTMRETKKQMKEDRESGKKKEPAVNPYKVAKETGRPVEEVIAEEQRKKAKARAKMAKKEKAEKRDYDNSHQSVKARAPIAAAGASYKSGNVAKAKAKNAEAAKKRAEKQKSKNKQRKKK
ncbi:MAG: hypothetical protein VZQ84_00665 [Anaerovoracaceae bacterium]|nr:hypothetical protein [Anaerovoracaceae bacterium]